MPDAAPGWERVAAAWTDNRQRVFDTFRDSSEWLIAHVRAGPGAVVLELAAGPGETGFLLAERVGSKGRVISTDISPAMVAAARRGAASRGLSNVETRVMDAQALDLDDDTVDAVVCRLGMMLVPDQPSAFAEARRVLRPGGALACTTIGPPDRNPWLATMVGALLQHGLAPPGDPFAPPGPFSLAAPERHHELLTAAGFTDIQTDEVDGAFSYADPDDYWDVMTSLTEPVQDAVASLSAAQQAEVRSTLAEMLEPFATDGGLALPTRVVASAATA